jgi:hypothetical protein
MRENVRGGATYRRAGVAAYRRERRTANGERRTANGERRHADTLFRHHPIEA